MREMLKNSEGVKGIRGVCYYAVSLVSVILICLSVFTALKMWFVNRSLWLDEAMLSYSLINRDFINLTSSQFDFAQSAPVAWLYFEKILISIFGHGEMVLRIPALLGYFGMLVSVYYISKEMLEIKMPLAPVAILASNEFLLKYSNVFKPYMTDALFTLLVIIIFYECYVKKQKPYVLMVLWMVLIWLSDPVCFLQGGILIVYGFKEIADRNRKGFINLFILGIAVVFSFLVNYFYWLKGTADDSSMQAFWALSRFPIIKNYNSLKYGLTLLNKGIFSELEPIKVFVTVLLLMSLVNCIYRRELALISMWVSFVLVLLASMMGKFPIANRLCMFVYPIIVIMVFYALDLVLILNGACYVLGSGVLILIALLNMSFPKMLYSKNYYWQQNEFRFSYNYLMQNIEKDESVCIAYSAKSQFLYYNDFNNETLANKGNKVNYEKDVADASVLLGMDKTYLCEGYMWQKWEGPSAYDMKLYYMAFQKQGHLEMIQNKYDTPLFYYCKNIEDVKTNVSMKLISKKAVEGGFQYKIKVTNIGKTIINNPIETVFVMCDGQSLAKLDSQINPGRSVCVNIRVNKQNAGQITLDNQSGLICQTAVINLN